MRILILSCGTGGGHNDAGRGAAQALTARGHEAVFLDDYLCLAGHGVDRAVCGAYIELVRRWPAGFRALYGVGRGASTLDHALGVPSPVYAANAAMAPRLRALLEQQPFDAVVMTHLYPAETLTRLKRSGVPLPPTLAVATDYTAIPFWEETDCDWYLTPDDSTARDFIRRGVPAARVRVLGGIPAPAVFSPSFDRAAVRRGLGFAPDRQYILVMGGSMGAGDLPRLVRQLRARMTPRMELIVLTGTNAVLQASLARAYAQDAQVSVRPRMGVAAPYLQACDLLFTKPGGLSSTESALCRIPTVFLAPLSPCEAANRAYFVAHGCALAPAGAAAAAAYGMRLLCDAHAAAAMRTAQRRVMPRNGGEALADFLGEVTAP